MFLWRRERGPEGRVRGRRLVSDAKLLAEASPFFPLSRGEGVPEGRVRGRRLVSDAKLFAEPSADSRIDHRVRAHPEARKCSERPAGYRLTQADRKDQGAIRHVSTRGSLHINRGRTSSRRGFSHPASVSVPALHSRPRFTSKLPFRASGVKPLFNNFCASCDWPRTRRRRAARSSKWRQPMVVERLRGWVKNLHASEQPSAEKTASIEHA
jgi:hypothetical protein